MKKTVAHVFCLIFLTLHSHCNIEFLEALSDPDSQESERTDGNLSAAHAQFSTFEDTVLSDTVYGSDSLGGVVSYELVALPTKGTAFLHPNSGALTYMPDPEANGTDQLTFRVFDGERVSEEALVEISIAPVNDAPVALDLTVAGIVEGPHADVFPGSDIDSTFVSEIVAHPILGVVSQDAATRTFTYTPNADQNGIDTIRFRMRDAEGLESDVKTVQLNVNTVNASPNYGADSSLVGVFADYCNNLPALPSRPNTVNIDSAWLASRGSGPYYLDQANTKYVLQTDVMAHGTAFVFLRSDIVLDLNGYSVHYGTGPEIIIPNGSFELGSGSLASLWDFSKSSNAVRHAGEYLYNEIYDGQYGVKFSLPAVDQKITSQGTITLQPNTTYSLSAMFEYGGRGYGVNPGVKGFVRLTGSGLPTREVNWAGTNTRGIQWREGVFTTGSSTETYLVEVGIENGSSAPSTAFYIDDIKIQQTRVYGATASAHSYAADRFPGVTRYGRGTNAIIGNGSLIQGSSGPSFGHGIYIDVVNGVRVEKVHISVNGANSSAISGRDQGSFLTTLLCNTLSSEVKTIAIRDHFNAALTYGVFGTIKNNTLVGGPHAGIVAFKQSLIENNDVRLKSKYTNGFGIYCSDGCHIKNNTVNCYSGDNACRGALSSGGPNGAIVEFNTIRVRNFIDNQEYEGEPLGGAYGIQLENAKNVVVRGNLVKAMGTEVAAAAFRMNNDGGSSDNNHIYNNHFFAVKTSTGHAATVKLASLAPDDMLFEKNLLETNEGIVQGTLGTDMTFIENHLKVFGPVSDPVIFEEGYYPPGVPIHTWLHFLDMSFEDSASRNYFESAIPQRLHRYGGGPTTRLVFSSNWAKKIIVKESSGATISGASVAVRDVNGTSVFSGTTDSKGEVVTEIREFETRGTMKSDFNSHRVTVTSGERSDDRTVDIVDSNDLIIVLP